MPEKKKKVDVKCTGSALLSFDKIVDFQGNLKRRSEIQTRQIITSIEKYGFSFPFFIWKLGKTNYCLDGHGRLGALALMLEEGWEIPALPVVYVQAKDRKEAKQKLLRMNSRYGDFDVDGLEEFVSDIEIELSELAIPELTDVMFGGDFETTVLDEASQYTTKVASPIYEITGECPKITDMIDRTKSEELLKKIGAAKLPEDIRGFLQHAAERHTVFRYDRIAEYYAHAEKNVQEIFEALALVIVDFKKAIENGWVQLSEKLQGIYDEEKS